MGIQNLLSKSRCFLTGIVVACALLFASNYVFSQEKETKKEIINPKREVFVVPAVTPANKNTDASQTKPKVKSMSPELLDDPWEEKLEKRDSTIEAESKIKNQENNNAQEMKTDTTTEDNKKTILKEDNTFKKEETSKNNKTNNSTKKN